MHFKSNSLESSSLLARVNSLLYNVGHFSGPIWSWRKFGLIFSLLLSLIIAPFIPLERLKTQLWVYFFLNRYAINSLTIYTDNYRSQAPLLSCALALVHWLNRRSSSCITAAKAKPLTHWLYTGWFTKFIFVYKIYFQGLFSVKLLYKFTNNFQ